MGLPRFNGREDALKPLSPDSQECCSPDVGMAVNVNKGSLPSGLDSIWWERREGQPWPRSPSLHPAVTQGTWLALTHRKGVMSVGTSIHVHRNPGLCAMVSWAASLSVVQYIQ